MPTVVLSLHLDAQRFQVLVALFLRHLARQTPDGDAADHHAARRGVHVEDRDGIAHLGQLARAADAGRARADDGDLLVLVMAGARADGDTHGGRAAARFSQQIETCWPSILLRRQTGSHGRAQVRPSTPGTTLECRLSTYASSKRPCEISPM